MISNTMVTFDKSTGFEKIESTVKLLFKESGFGTLTQIDVKSVMKEKLGVDVNAYKILGMCNPKESHKLLDIDPFIGLLLPCNVIIFERDNDILVSVVNPIDLLPTNENEQITETANKIQTIFEKIMSDLKLKLT